MTPLVLAFAEAIVEVVMIETGLAKDAAWAQAVKYAETIAAKFFPSGTPTEPPPARANDFDPAVGALELELENELDAGPATPPAPPTPAETPSAKAIRPPPPARGTPTANLTMPEKK